MTLSQRKAAFLTALWIFSALKRSMVLSFFTTLGIWLTTRYGVENNEYKVQKPEKLPANQHFSGKKAEKIPSPTHHLIWGQLRRNPQRIVILRFNATESRGSTPSPKGGI